MSFVLNNISFQNFRNYRKFEIEDLQALTILVGPNAVGKTNIIEGVQLITSLSSLKNASVDQLILWGEPYARIEANIKDDKRNLDIALFCQEGKKLYSLQGKTKRPKDLRGLFPSVLFCPDDLSLIKGTQSLKRNTLDILGSQLAENYHVIKKDYEKILRHKNTLLKEDYPQSVLESVNETLITIGAQYYWYRNSLFNRLLPFIKSYYQIIVEERETLDVSYIPSWESSTPEQLVRFEYTKDDAIVCLRDTVERKMKEERIRKHALVGPHADKIEFFINGKNAALYGSQGQQRSLVLSYKLAEVSVIQEISSQKPLLLLDDVMSELDSRRREALLSFINGDIQTIITTTHLEYFPKNIKNQASLIEFKEDKEAGKRGI